MFPYSSHLNDNLCCENSNLFRDVKVGFFYQIYRVDIDIRYRGVQYYNFLCGVEALFQKQNE